MGPVGLTSIIAPSYSSPRLIDPTACHCGVPKRNKRVRAAVPTERDAHRLRLGGVALGVRAWWQKE